LKEKTSKARVTNALTTDDTALFQFLWYTELPGAFEGRKCFCTMYSSKTNQRTTKTSTENFSKC